MSALAQSEQSDIISRRNVRGIRGNAAFSNALIESEREIVRRSRMLATEPSRFRLSDMHGPALDMNGRGASSARPLSAMTAAEIDALPDPDIDDESDELHVFNRGRSADQLRDEAIARRVAKFEAAERLREQAIASAKLNGGLAEHYTRGGPDDPTVRAFARSHRLSLREASETMALDGDLFKTSFRAASDRAAAADKAIDDQARRVSQLWQAHGENDAATKEARTKLDTMKAERQAHLESR